MVPPEPTGLGRHAAAPEQQTLGRGGSDPLVVQSRSLAIRRGAVAVHARAITLTGGKFWPPQCIEELGCSIMHRGGAVVSRSGPHERCFDARHAPRLRPTSSGRFSLEQQRHHRLCASHLDRRLLGARQQAPRASRVDLIDE
jgi:hypothetical protein